MKRALILHGMEGHGHAHWFPWLKLELEARGYEVWVPDLPVPETPNAKLWTDFLLSREDWDFNNNLVVGHSAGAVEILQLIQALPPGKKIAAGVACAAFTDELPASDPDFSALQRMFEPSLDFEAIKSHSDELIFVHAKDDPWCPWKQAEHLAKQTDGDFVLLPTGRHFTTSLDPEFRRFPGLIEILEARDVL